MVLKSSSNLFNKIIPVVMGASILCATSIGALYGQSQEKFNSTINKFNPVSIEEIVQNVSSWDGAKNYLSENIAFVNDQKNYGFSFEAPFKMSHEKKSGDFEDFAVIAAALLMDDEQYTVQKMSIYNELKNSPIDFDYETLINNYVVALVFDKETNLYGALGVNGTDNIKPQFESPEEVFEKINASFFNKYDNFVISDYDKNSLLEGYHPVDMVIKEHEEYYKENKDNVHLFIIYKPEFSLDDSTYMFIHKSDLDHFDYKDISQWNSLFEKHSKLNKLLTEIEFFRTVNLNVSIYYLDSVYLEDKKNHRVYVK